MCSREGLVMCGRCHTERDWFVHVVKVILREGLVMCSRCHTKRWIGNVQLGSY